MTPKIALDTNAYRALDDGNSVISEYVKSASQVSLPIIVLGEIYFGIYLGKRRDINTLNLNRFLSVPRVEILNIDDSTARLFGEISTELRLKGKSIQQNDIWIAALCKQYNYALATNDSGFTNVIGLTVLNF